jgi:LmbE family N-acetylglucosaminyl deacetylase
MAQRAEVARWIRQLRPQVVLGHDPWKRYRLHPDHRHAGQLAVEGVVAARDPHFFPEQGLAHHRPGALLLFEADEPDHVEDVQGHVEVKLAALEAHRSQLLSTMKIEVGSADEAAQREAFRDEVRTALREHGALAGITYGEAFKLINTL